MRCRVALIAAVAIALGVAGSAWAFPPSNPFIPDAGNIQTMIDRTLDFSGQSQASTETHSNIPGGIKVNADWFLGNSILTADPNAMPPIPLNESFTRLVLTHQYGNNASGNPALRGDLSAFNGVKWCISSTIDMIVKPYTQVGTTFTFGEGTQPGDPASGGTGTFTVPGDGLLHMVQIDWNMVNNFAGGTIPLPPGTNMTPGGGTRQDIFEHGFQIFLPNNGGLAQDTGQHLLSMFTITQWVPEPSTFVLAGMGAIGMIGMARRKFRK